MPPRKPRRSGSTSRSPATRARYQFDDLGSFAGANRMTLFRDCVAVVEAEAISAHEAGDHSIFVAQILWARVDPTRSPLVYAQSNYATLSPLLGKPAHALS